MKIQIKSKIKPPYTINQIKLGNKKKFGIKITKKIHNSFSKFSGDKSPLHKDRKFCKKNGFKNLVGYAFLIECLLSKIYGMYFPGGSELCLQHTSNFIRPFYINDYFDIELIVIQKNLKAKLITLNIKIYVKKNLIFNGETILNLTLKK
tara:strand:- start:1533 stop:1979 length:447 start_codon:yes stop_codon:yes gene_type:complete